MDGSKKSRARWLCGLLIATAAAGILLVSCGSSSLSAQEIHDTIDGLGYDVTYQQDSAAGESELVSGVARDGGNSVRFWVASGNDAADQPPAWEAEAVAIGLANDDDLHLWMDVKDQDPEIPGELMQALCDERVGEDCGV